MFAAISREQFGKIYLHPTDMSKPHIALRDISKACSYANDFLWNFVAYLQSLQHNLLSYKQIRKRAADLHLKHAALKQDEDVE